MENTAHSYTEAAECNFFEPIEAVPKIDETLNALHDLVALHNREMAGDETITMKEWNGAIKSANKVIENKLNP